MDLKDNTGGKFDFNALMAEARSAAEEVHGQLEPARSRCWFRHTWSEWGMNEEHSAQMRCCLDCGKAQVKVLERACAHHWHTIGAIDVKRRGEFDHEAYRQACCRCGQMAYRGR